MRYFVMCVTSLLLLSTAPLAAHEEEGHDEESRPVPAHEHRRERAERRHRRARQPLPHGRAWIGVGAGVGFATVDVPCSPGSFDNDCSESGDLRTYSANLTASGRNAAVRVRAVRDQDKGNDRRTPYETAALIGSRFGRSNWYGLVGAGRIRHADDRFSGDANGFAWEILFAPSSDGGAGLELSFHGNTGRDVDYTAFNLGMRFGAVR